MSTARRKSGEIESIGTGRYARTGIDSARIRMNAVSAGKWVRYQSGGGQTANSHSTKSAVAAAMPARPSRMSRTGSAGFDRRNLDRSRLRGLDRLSDFRHRDGHLVGLDPVESRRPAVEPHEVREAPGSLRLHLEGAPALDAAAGAGEGSHRHDRQHRRAPAARRISRAVLHDRLLLHLERIRHRGLVRRVTPAGAGPDGFFRQWREEQLEERPDLAADGALLA